MLDEELEQRFEGEVLSVRERDGQSVPVDQLAEERKRSGRCHSLISFNRRAGYQR